MSAYIVRNRLAMLILRMLLFAFVTTLLTTIQKFSFAHPVSLKEYSTSDKSSFCKY